MEQNMNMPQQPAQTTEKSSGKLWLIILALVILVGIVLFAMSNTTKAPGADTEAVGTTQESMQAATSVDDVDNTASIEQQLKNINIGDVADDMKPIDTEVNSVQ